MKTTYSQKFNIFAGQALIEYALILVLGVIISVLGLHLLGINMNNLFNKMGGIFDPQSKTLFSDNFENLDSWKKINGPNCWNTNDGILQTTKSSCNSVLMNTTELPDDYQVSMDLAQLLSGDGYGLMFRLSKNQNSYTGYSFQVDHGYGDKFVIRRFDKNGTELGTPLAVGTPPVGFDINAQHKVNVVVNGDNFTAYVDGTQVLSATDSTYSTGNAGIRTWDSSKNIFSGFSVSTP